MEEYENEFSILKDKYIAESKKYYILLEKIQKSENVKSQILEKIRNLQSKYKGR